MAEAWGPGQTPGGVIPVLDVPKVAGAIVLGALVLLLVMRKALPVGASIGG